LWLNIAGGNPFHRLNIAFCCQTVVGIYNIGELIEFTHLEEMMKEYQYPNIKSTTLYS
jgi:hypothetical protein